MANLLLKNGLYLTQSLELTEDRTKAKIYTAKMENLTKVAVKYLIYTYEDYDTKEQFDMFNVDYITLLVQKTSKILNHQYYLNGGCTYFAESLLNTIYNILGNYDTDYKVIRLENYTEQGGEHYAVEYYNFNDETGIETEIAWDVTGIIDTKSYTKSYCDLDILTKQNNIAIDFYKEDKNGRTNVLTAFQTLPPKKKRKR